MRSRLNAGRLLVLGGVLLVVALVAGCGSSGDDSGSGTGTGASTSAAASESGGSGGVAEAKQIDAKLRKQPTGIEVKTPIDKPVPTGKTIDFLTCASPGCVVIANRFKDAAGILGWKVKVLTVQAVAAEINKAYTTAIRDRPDGIAVVGVSSEVARPQLAKLDELGIPVVTAQDPDEKFPPIVASVYTHKSSLQFGRWHADDMIARGCDKGTTVYIDVGGFIVLKYMREGFQAEAKRLAPDMKITVVDIAATKEGESGDPVVGAVRKDPKVTCVFGASDPLITGLPQKLKGAGVTKLPQIFSDFGADTTLQYIKDGLATATALGDAAAFAYIMADGLARHFAGVSTAPTEDATQQMWIVDKDNAPASVPYSNTADLKEQYTKLWGKG